MTASKMFGWALVVDVLILAALLADVYISYQNSLILMQMNGVRYGR